MNSFYNTHSYEHTLANGLRIITVPQTALHRASLILYIAVGSRYETTQNNGISHFLEHMLYRGTPNYPSAHTLNLEFEKLGGGLSATTRSDHTTLEVSVPPSKIEHALSLLGEVVRCPRLGEIEIERGIVHEEICEDLDENGRQINIDNITRSTLFKEHPLGFTITGPLSALEHFDEAALRAHLDEFYVGSNMVLAVAGACEHEQICAWAETAFECLPQGQPSQFEPFKPSQQRIRRKHVPSQGSQSDVCLSFLTPGEHDALAPAIEMLLRVMDDGMSTRLYHRLCDNTGLVYDCSAHWEPYIDCGIFDIEAEVQHARLPQVISVCLSLLYELAEQGPTTDEVEKAKTRYRWALEASLDDADELAAMFGAAVLFNRPRSFQELALRYDSVSVALLRDVAQQIFHPRHLLLSTVGILSSEAREQLRLALRNYRQQFRAIFN